MSDLSPPYSEQISDSGRISVYRSETLVPYLDATAWMEQRASDISKGLAAEAIWFLEHPPLYTAGTSAKDNDLLQPDRFPVHQVGRGGQYTYHGPGQRVVYVMLNLEARGKNIRAFVKNLEQWIIDTLDAFSVKGTIREGRVGVWVETGEDIGGIAVEEKIAAIGIRVRRWVSFHGLAINVCPSLEHFSGIVPCGLSSSSFGVTSLEALGCNTTLHEVDTILLEQLKFEQEH